MNNNVLMNLFIYSIIQLITTKINTTHIQGELP